MLSPVPAVLPMPAIPSSMQTFRALTEDSDTEELLNRKLLQPRSAQPIAIKPNVHRIPSKTALLTRHDTDPLPRSAPRSSIDVHMGSCSSSPVVSGNHYTSRDRLPSDSISGSVGSHDSVSNRRPLDSRRTSTGATTESRDPEEQDTWRQQAVRDLRDLLGKPPPTPEGDRPQQQQRQYLRKYEGDSDKVRRMVSPETSTPVTRNTSPTSSAAPTPPPGPIQNSLLQRPISKASTAAMQVEREQRERARAYSLKEQPTSTNFSPQYVSKDRNVDIPPYSQSQQTRPPFPRRQSTSDSIRSMKPSSNSSASALTRTMWAMQEAQSQRVL
ncbi:hypothetical protein C8Q75DRAFT_520506 [Abortiporus biennis]|nr:hypothetical protein C8Q75DRAFT_520506 [Abortiporus biennis]